MQLVSRLPLFANRSALALNKKNTHHPKVCPFFHVPKLIKVELQVSQWPAFGGSSSLGALCSLKPYRTNSQLAKKNKSPEYTKVFTSFSVSDKKLEGRANKTFGGVQVYSTPHDCKIKFSQVLASALKNLRVVQTKRTVVCKCLARPILVLLKLFNHNKKTY